MKFEFLPNEILMECFQYLNGPDIFYSFDRLNYRFHTLIRSIQLHINFQNVNKFAFMRFCEKMLSDPDIKHQIISLNLLNDNRFDQNEIFFSHFWFTEFPNLQSLTLSQYIDYDTIEQIMSILPSLEYLRSFYLSDQASVTNHILFTLSKLKLKILSLPNLSLDLKLLDRTMTITSLRITRCNVETLSELFQYSPMLKYLSIERLEFSWFLKCENNPPMPVICLKQFRIETICFFSFVTFEELIKQTPNLNILTIFAKDNNEMINVDLWQSLITSLLPHLNIFQFHFTIHSSNILNKFQKFQTNFWHQQKHWYTNYEINNNSGSIYTIPYLSNEYCVTSNTNKHWNSSITGSSDVFINVTYLYLPINVITKIKNSQYYFRNVKSLIITYMSDDFDESSNDKLDIKHILSLKMIVNLFNIRHLDISDSVSLESSFVLLEILKETPQLLSLDFDKSILMSFLKNDELCDYLNKMIKTLKINRSSNDKTITSDEIGLFCETFSNLESLECSIGSSENLLFILQKLSKLSRFEFDYEIGTFPENIDSWLTKNAFKLNNNCVFAYSCEPYSILAKLCKLRKT